MAQSSAAYVGLDAVVIEEFHPHHHHGLVSHHTIVAIALALASALAFALATVAQQRAASQISDSDADSGRMLFVLIRRPLWWGGTLGNLAGYVLQAWALGYGSLLVVAPLLVTSVLFALPLEARAHRRPVQRAVWLWGLVLVMSLAVFVVLGNPNRGRAQPTPRAWLVMVCIAAPLLVMTFLAGMRRRGASRSSLIALVVGVLAGVLAMLTKVVVLRLEISVPHTLAHPEIWALVVVGLTGVYLQQLSFQAGSLRTSMPIIYVVEPVTAGVLGVSMLGEVLRVDDWKIGLFIVVTALMAYATVELARGKADVESS